MSERPQIGLPHVTDIIRLAGLMPDYMSGDPESEVGTTYSMQRGTAVHAATQYLDEGTLDQATVAFEILPYIGSYERFLAERKPKIKEIEKFVVSETLGYCGTLDRIAEIDGLLGVVDLKTGSKARWHGLQTSAYATAVGVYHRWSLYLGPTGYHLEPHTNRRDFRAFSAALELYSWRNND